MQAKGKEQEQGRNPWSRCPGRPAKGLRSREVDRFVRWPLPGSVRGTSPRGTTRLTSTSVEMASPGGHAVLVF
jgi:hypothetical protein